METSISAQTPTLFANGPNSTWTNVYTACQIGDEIMDLNKHL